MNGTRRLIVGATLIAVLLAMAATMSLMRALDPDQQRED